MFQTPLFQTQPSASPQTPFQAWMASLLATKRIRSPATARLYQEMWDSFTAWCTAQNPPVTLETLKGSDLNAFLASRSGLKSDDISSLHALRQLRLIEHVLQHQAGPEDRTHRNPATEVIATHPDIKYADVAAAGSLPQVLDGHAVKTLMLFLSASRPRPGTMAMNLHWQEIRNRTSVSLQLGAGLGPAEIRLLTLESPVVTGSRVKDRPWKLRIPATGDAPAHEAPIAIWAAELLQHWLAVRTEQGIPGAWLFPSTKTGKPWGKSAQYSAAKAVFQEAGLGDVAGGSFLLRHTFALRQLRKGIEPRDVAQWLGITDPKVMARYTRMLGSPAEPV